MTKKLTSSDTSWHKLHTAFRRKKFSGPGKRSRKSSRDKVVSIASLMFAATLENIYQNESVA